MLGKPLMPWQQHVANVILEIDPVTRELAYSEFGLTVPRQSGKSTLILALAVHRASAGEWFGGRQQIVYTAQTRKDARKKWEEDFAGDLAVSRAFKSKVVPHFGNGNEHLRFPNRSRFGIESTTEKAGHGGTIDVAFIDEAFAQVDNRMEQAFRPAMITRRNKQLGWVSTAGWRDASPYLEAKVKRGREQVAMGIREGLAYFEWSAPDGAQIDDCDVWRGCMPALGYTISEQAIAAELQMAISEGKPNDFRRAYLNLWVPKLADEGQVIPAAAWEFCLYRGAVQLQPMALAVDVSPDRAWASIVAAGVRDDGLVHVEVVDRRSGTSWVVARLAALCRQWRLPVYLDPAGPVGSLILDLEAESVDVLLMNTREMAQSCGAFYDAVLAGRLRHLGQPELDEAVTAAIKRVLGDSWAWSRKGDADISPLVAATVALHGMSAYTPTSSPLVDTSGSASSDSWDDLSSISF